MPTDGIYAATTPRRELDAALVQVAIEAPGLGPEEVERFVTVPLEFGLTGIPGAVPGVARYPAGCRFHPRCLKAIARCQTDVPQPRPHDQGMVACHVAGGRDA